MSRGKSGRIVLEIDPIIKRNLYLALEKEQITLKEWFVMAANQYIKQNLNKDYLYCLQVAEESLEFKSSK